MSQASLNQFLSKIIADATLQDQLKDVTDKAAFTQTLLRLGKEHGFDFTAEDVEAVLMTNKTNPLEELSDAQLAQVAGGRPAATSDGCGSAWTTLFGWCN